MRALRRALASPAARTAGKVLLALLVAFLWLNMVRRAMKGSGSQYDDFTLFARDLLFDRTNVYALYPDWNTITKYPPFFAFLLAPVALFPDWLGASIWFWVSLVLAVAATVLAVRLSDDGSARRPLARAFFVLPFLAVAGIVVSNLETAQVNIAILFLTVWGLAFWRQRMDWTAGGLIGVAAAIKLTPGIFLPYFLWKRSWKAAAGIVTGLVLCWFVVQPIVLGPEFFGIVMRSWTGEIRPFLERGVIAEGIGGFRHTNQSLAAALGRFLTDVPADAGRGVGFSVNVASLDPGIVRGIVRGIQVAILVALAWLCRTPTDDRTRIGHALEFSLVLAAPIFLTPIAWINHYVALLVGFAAAVYWVRTRPAGLPERRWLLGAAIAAAVLLATSISRLALAWSLPLLGAALLSAATAAALRREHQYG